MHYIAQMKQRTINGKTGNANWWIKCFWSVSFSLPLFPAALVQVREWSCTHHNSMEKCQFKCCVFLFFSFLSFQEKRNHLRVPIKCLPSQAKPSQIHPTQYTTNVCSCTLHTTTNQQQHSERSSAQIGRHALAPLIQIVASFTSHAIAIRNAKRTKEWSAFGWETMWRSSIPMRRSTNTLELLCVCLGTEHSHVSQHTTVQTNILNAHNATILYLFGKLYLYAAIYGVDGRWDRYMLGYE